MKNHHRGLIDLHLHLDGSLSLTSVKKLAALSGVALPDDETLLKQLQVSPDCRDLNEYLTKFAFPCSLLQTEEAIALAVQTLCEELQEQGLIYAEIRFAPQLHLLKGLTQDKVVAAACEGLHRTDFPAGLILCAMRGDNNREENLVTVRMTEKYLGRGVCACDLAGAEALFPTKDFKELFDLAKELDVPYTIHAGEADGPELAEQGITLECCPTSNLHTCMFPSYEAYPLKELLAKGLKVTVNTDNMTVSGVTLSHELEKLDLTPDQAKQVAINAANAAFVDEDDRMLLLEQIEEIFA